MAKEKKKRKFKMPDSFTILYLIIIIIAILTFFVPSGEYTYECSNGQDAINYVNPNSDNTDGEYVCPKNDADAEELNAATTTGAKVDSSKFTKDAKPEYHQIDQKPQGLWQIFNAPTDGFYEAIDIALFVLVIGGFLNVVIKTGALDAGINSLLVRYKGREQWLIPILMVLFAIGGTTYGMAEETIAFYLLIVPIFYRAGYDAMTGFMVIMLGAGIGVLGSTVNPFATGVASAAAGVGLGDGIVGRTILWVVLTIITIIFVMRYAKKVKEDPSKSAVYDLKAQHDKEFLKDADVTSVEELEKLNIHQKVILWIFGLSFVLMVVSVIPWTSFGFYGFQNFADWINQFKIIGGSEGTLALGDWFFRELTSLFLLMAIIVGIYAKLTGLLKESFIDTFIDGAKDLLSVALIIGLARGIQVVLSSSGMESTILYYGSQVLQNLGQTAFILGTFIFYIPLSFLIPSTSGAATATIPIMGPLGAAVYGSAAGTTQVITAFSAAEGLVNIITPTSGVVVGGLALAKIPYDRWVRFITPFLVVVGILCCVFFILTNMFGFFI